MRYAWLWTVGAFAAAAMVGCGSSGGGDSTSSGAGAGSVCGLAPVGNTEYCAADPATPDCTTLGAVQLEACGVPLKEPQEELERSANVDEFAGSGAPKLDCYTPAGYPARPSASPPPVTVRGTVKIFSNGCESKSVTLEVWTVNRTSGDDDGSLGTMVASPITTPASCQGTAGEASDDPDSCGTRYECFYEVAGVPSETELVFKTYSTTAPALWAPIYEYNVYAFPEEIVDGVWEHNVRALAAGDYTVIPQAAIGGNVTPLHGVLAGEVHDCENVRLVNAVVDIDQQKAVTTYFTNNEEHPLPDLGGRATSTLGLYAAMDIRPGPVTVAAAGMVGGQYVSAGFFRARIFEDSVTSVTFRGLRPFQVPADEGE
jgi:hypothetical protein